MRSINLFNYLILWNRYNRLVSYKFGSMNLADTAVKFYTWKDYRLVYEVSGNETSSDTPGLLLIYPIGVGLSRCFWHPFIASYLTTENPLPVYNPDLLGCGANDLPRLAYYPEDWGAQLQYFLETVVKKPVIVITQGASAPVAFSLVEKCSQSNLIKGLIFAGPPAWKLISKKGNSLQQKLLWNLLFDTPFGAAFYRYARRRKFLKSFSERQLFANRNDVDDRWLDTLEKGAADLQTRHAVFSFLAGFWIDDYSDVISSISQPTLVIFGDRASSISSTGATETPEERLALYLKHLPNGQGKIIPGRNVLPYESTADFVGVVSDFVRQIVK